MFTTSNLTKCKK